MTNAAFTKLLNRETLSRAESKAFMAELMAGRLSPEVISGILSVLHTKGETVDEITGAAEAMRDAAIAVTHTLPFVVDTCGTGGDGRGTFNISTAAAFIVSAAGFPVAKHGNRSVSSRCGSADLLEEVGVKIEMDPDIASHCLQEVGITFLFAPKFHPAMKHAMPVRQALGIRTIFNLLGPLTNPARPAVQLMGIYDEALVEPIARVLIGLGCKEGYVVHSMEGSDEISLAYETKVAEIHNGATRMTRWTASNFGVGLGQPTDTLGGDRTSNAKTLLQLLKGEKIPVRGSVCANAAAAIAAASRFSGGAGLSLSDAYVQAEACLDNGKALQKLEALKRVSHG